MFIGTIWAFTYKHSTRDVNWTMVAVATLLFLLSTADIVLVIIRVENGLVKYRYTFPGGPEAFLADVSQPTFLAKNVIYTLQTLLGDGVVPFLQIFAGLTGIWILVFLAFTLATNLFSSGLVAYRIWTIERKVSTVRVTKRKIGILRVLVDAAILYSVALCPFITLFASSTPTVFYVMGDLLVPIISIAFYMVFIRIAISKHTPDRGTSGTERITTIQFRIPPLQSGFRQNDMSFWPTAQK
ncbi:hypothetical protein DEU56DRAFT_941381 [Suillus clintonianus]|uniref:uncharacterized protein n=1 Tax=Suillus clintonianus TaxID=1904413 RepID=UPI001B87D42D|nr:uncharacterized protein DEU56DRAFT_941381 [Suillus clintonianus]KAG2141102.1 hypothetical protein DEU56DRAFT_941381 [Suillus clintonianus]